MANEKKMDQVILGLLDHESLTGYEIKKRIDTMLKYFWSASYGSIYPTLNALEKNALVTKENTVESGREKIIYTITDSGREQLKEWLALPVTKDELRYETLLKLFFGSAAGREVSIEHIQDFEDKISNELPLIKRSIATLKSIQGEEDHKYYMLTAMFGEKVFEAYLEWCTMAKEMLSK